MRWKQNKKTLIAMLIFLGLAIFTSLYSIIGENPDRTVPLFGLNYRLFIILASLVIPILGTFVAVIVFPRLTPFFLKTKAVISLALSFSYQKYNNVYVKIKEPSYLKKFFPRAFIVYLLSVGLGATLVASGLIDLRFFFSKDYLEVYIAEGLALEYTIQVFLLVPMLMLPIAIGLLSIGWTLEDAGLIHYKLPDEQSSELFEIEPIHMRYNALIEGFAGLSVLIYVVGAVNYYLTNFPDKTVNILLILVSGVLIIGISVPGYLLYCKLNKEFLLKGLKEVERITELKLKS